jgi:hypothetical protein
VEPRDHLRAAIAEREKRRRRVEAVRKMDAIFMLERSINGLSREERHGATVSRDCISLQVTEIPG